MRKLFGLLPLLIIVLSACAATPVDLPLADNRPTFLFFYTDG
mgnify:CR=1 FL=1